MPSESTYIRPKMKTPTEKPKTYHITLKNAAGAACTTSKKMAECLGVLGVAIDPDRKFSLGELLCAVRMRCDPHRADRALKRAMKRSITKVFGKPTHRKVTA